MKVLIISTDLRISTPAGAAYIAGAARSSGHAVEVFDAYLSDDVSRQLDKVLAAFSPDVVGLSITAVTSDVVDAESEFGTRYVDNRPKIKMIVDTVKDSSSAQIVLGGNGFNYYAEDWLNYLNLDYGIRGEGEYAFPVYLERLAEEGDLTTVPGAVFRSNGKFIKANREPIQDLDGTAYPAYGLFDSEVYRQRNIPFAIFTKRGCAFGCTFCPHSSLEGTRYRLKSPERVVNEIKHVVKTTGSARINFADNSYNCPRSHAEAICRAIVRDGLDIKWQSGAIKPIRLTREFCGLMKASGCEYVGLSIESASERVLREMHRGYDVNDVRKALDNMSQSGIPFGLSIMLGTPAETPDTIAETFDLIAPYTKVQSIWVNIGIYLWTDHQKIVGIARSEGQLTDDRRLFDGAYYVSPSLSEGYMTALIDDLRSRKNVSVQVNKPYAGYDKRVNALH